MVAVPFSLVTTPLSCKSGLCDYANYKPLCMANFVYILSDSKWTHIYMHKFHCLSADPKDYSSAGRYNVSFSQTALLDIFEPLAIAQSSPIVIDIMSDDTFEGIEYFQASIVETADFERVRIGQDTVNVTIIDSESLFLSDKFSLSTK